MPQAFANFPRRLFLMNSQEKEGICANVPFSDEEQLEILPYRDNLVQQLLAFRAGAGVFHAARSLRRREEQVPWPNPATAYQMLFFERLDPYIVAAVSRLYAGQGRENVRLCGRVLAGALPRVGFLYVFRHERDSGGVVKVGSTTRTPETRVQEWRTRLQGASGAGNDQVTLLFSQRVPGHLVHFVERVVHALLTCQWVSGRVDRVRGVKLTEYFFVRNLQALRLLLQAAAAHAKVTFPKPAQ